MTGPVRLAGLTLASPVLVASGCGGTGRELAGYAPLSTYGAFVTRTITLTARPGGPAPRVLESPAGLLHATGLPNPGLTAFCATELPALVQAGARVVVSVAGESVAEVAEVVSGLARTSGVSAVELALSLPDAEVAGVRTPREPFATTRLVEAAVAQLPPGVPLLAKIWPDPVRAPEHARAAVEGGAAAVVVGGAQPAAFPDGRHAGLSGPAVAPLALRAVAEVVKSLDLAGLRADVVGCGGIATVADARAHLDAGAVAVAVGSALLTDPTAAARIAEGLAVPERPAPEKPAPEHAAPEHVAPEQAEHPAPEHRTQEDPA
ncbi:dihydroorotate dehydrogenase [Nocardioides sp. GY 10127]|uniref:dihydroorotate dehydrogenase n=1 Tax=Nocardioides sp. GY 10127 TaxID=2569762 RepID=UPI0014588E2B|nr:dihydroorotate dehydrogenase [Nocardioides sp. GY 10127]